MPERVRLPGRLVRAAIAMAVADVEAQGADAELVSRLQAS